MKTIVSRLQNIWIHWSLLLLPKPNQKDKSKAQRSLKTWTFVNFNSKNNYFQRISAWWGVVISAVTLFWSEMPDWDTDAEVQILFFATMAPKSRLARGTEVPWWRKRMLIKSYEITKKYGPKGEPFLIWSDKHGPWKPFFWRSQRNLMKIGRSFCEVWGSFLEMEWLVFGSFPTFSSLAIIPWMGLENPGNLPDHNWDRGIWLAARRSVAASTPLHIIGIKFIPRWKSELNLREVNPLLAFIVII